MYQELVQRIETYVNSADSDLFFYEGRLADTYQVRGEHLKAAHLLPMSVQRTETGIRSQYIIAFLKQDLPENDYEARRQIIDDMYTAAFAFLDQFEDANDIEIVGDPVINAEYQTLSDYYSGVSVSMTVNYFDQC